MVRGSNAQFNFYLPYNCSYLTNVVIAFWQNGYSGISTNRPLPIIKQLNQCIILDLDDNKLSVILNTEETLRFTDKLKAYVQLKGFLSDGTSFVGNITPIVVRSIYDDMIFGDPSIFNPDSSVDGVLILDGRPIVDPNSGTVFLNGGVLDGDVNE